MRGGDRAKMAGGVNNNCAALTLYTVKEADFVAALIIKACRSAGLPAFHKKINDKHKIMLDKRKKGTYNSHRVNDKR